MGCFPFAAKEALIACCTALKTSREIKNLPADPDRLCGTGKSKGKFTGDQLAFSVRLTTLQFPGVIFTSRRP
jgi:hypothetical protein